MSILSWGYRPRIDLDAANDERMAIIQAIRAEKIETDESDWSVVD